MHLSLDTARLLSPHFQYRDGQLYAESVAVEELVQRYGTPLYIYSRAALEGNYRLYTHSLGDYPHMVCYSVKASSNLAILHCLGRAGAGFDVVSGGELERVIAAGADAARVVFSGVGKTAAEIEKALSAGVHCINLESAGELETLAEIVKANGSPATVAVRVNPDINAGGHPHIATGHRASKFGISRPEALAVCRRISDMPQVQLRGIHCHLGSQIREAAPLLDALEHLLHFAETLASEEIQVEHVNLGGGIAVAEQEQSPPNIPAILAAILERLQGSNLRLVLEPGRSIAATAGILVGKILYLKDRYAIANIGMNDFLRPALYDAWHPLLPLRQQDGEGAVWDVAGPICENGDVLGRERTLALRPGSHIAIGMAGAYGFSMSSNYNSRPRPAEVMTDGEQAYIIRERESFHDLVEGERLPPQQ